MKKRKIAKAALAVLSMLTIGASGAAFAACDGCGNEHEHTYGKWSITIDPTLSDGGKAERNCESNDHTDTKDLPALTDTSVWTENTAAAVSPTHTTDGSRTFSSEYGTVTITVPKDADAHTYGTWTITQKPTMDEGGKAKHTCTETDKHEEEVDIPALSNTDVWTVDSQKSEAATHTKAGKTVYTSVYGDVEVEIPANAGAHTYGDWTFEEGKTPTLNDGGKIKRVCGGDNSHVETKDVPALSDTEFWAVTVKTPATHQSSGIADYNNTEYNLAVADIVLPKVAHTFGKWTVTVDPTDDEEGEATRVCTETGCASDATATEKFTLPPLSDKSFWTAGTPVEADYNHPGSITYTNETYGSVTVITAPKLPAPYEGKTYASLNFYIDTNGNVRNETAWDKATITVGDDGVGYGTGYPFNGKFVFELVDAGTGLVKISQYSVVSSGSVGGGDEEWGGAEGYALRAGTEYETEVNSIIYAYVDMTTGVMIMQRNNSWSDVHVIIPSETPLLSADFNACSVAGDLLIAYNKGAAPFNILVTDEGSFFNVALTDIWGNALTVANSLSNQSGTLFVKDNDGEIIKGYAIKNQAWVVTDGYEGIYAIKDDEDGRKVFINGASSVAVMNADGTTPFGVGSYIIISENVIGATLVDISSGDPIGYYEYTLSGDGMSQAGGTCTEAAPEVTISINYNGYAPDGTENVVTEVISKFTQYNVGTPVDDEMIFRGWFTDAGFENEAEVVDGKYVVTADVTLYAKWAEKVTLKLSGLLAADADKATIVFGDGDIISEYLDLYEADQIDGNKYFAGWYIDAACEEALGADDVVTAVDKGATLYAKWADVNALYGEYSGRQMLSGGVIKEANVTVDVRGNITGTVDTKTFSGKIMSYGENADNRMLVNWTPDDVKTYCMWFDAVSGILVIPDDFSKTEMDQYPFVLSNSGSIGENQSFSYSLSGPIQGKTKIVVHNDERLVLIFDNKIYGDVTLTDAFGAELAFDDLQTAKTLVVKQNNNVVLAIGSKGDTLHSSKDDQGNSVSIQALDAYYGIKNIGGVEYKLDGVGGISWNDGKDHSGIYTYVKDDNGDKVFDVFERERIVDTTTGEDDDGEPVTTTTISYKTVAYYELRLGDTNSFTKPVVTIAFVSSQGNAVAPVNVNLKIAYTPAALDNITTHVFRGWYLDDQFNDAVPEGYIPTEDDIFYAKWLEKATLTVDYKDGVEGASRVETYEYGKGETVKLDNPTREGFKLIGWYTDADLNNEWTDTEITGDLNLYAKWVEADVYMFVNYHFLAMSQNGVGSGTNANGSGHWIGRITFDENGCAPSASYPINKGTSLISNFNKEEGTLTYNINSSNVDGGKRGFIDVDSNIIVATYDNDDFNQIIIFTPEYADYKESYWNSGKTKTISFTFNGSTYCIFVHNSNVYFNVSLKTATGEDIAATAAYQSATLYVRNSEGGLIAKFGYDGTVMNELDGYEDITYTGAMGDLTVNGVATITLNGVEGTYSLNKEVGATYTADAYIGDSYYEVTLDKDASTYTIVKPMVNVTFTTDYDAANTISGEKNKNIAITLPTLTDANNVFRGWYIDDDTKLLSGEYVPKADVEFTAKWDIKVTLTVVYGNGMENATLVYGAGDTAAPVEPAFKDGKAFDHWYISDDNGVTEKTTYTAGAISEDTTIYAAWISAVAMLGKYEGVNISSSNGTKAVDRNAEISAAGVIVSNYGQSPSSAPGTVKNYNSETGVFDIYYSDEKSTYGFYLPDEGIIAWGYYDNREYFGNDIMFYFAEGTVTSVDYSAPFCSGNTYFEFGRLLTVNRKDGSKLNLYVDNRKIVCDVTWVATNDKGAVTEYETKNLGNATTVIVKNSASEILMARGKKAGTWQELDGTQGIYTNGDDSFTLDGVETIVWGERSGTYKAAPEGSDYTYDVTLKNPSEYFRVTVTGNNFTAVKPETLITFNLSGKGNNFTHNQNLNVTLDLRSNDIIPDPVAEGFIFKGWYSEEGGTGSRVWEVRPTTSDEIIVYAKWATAYKVTLVYNDGSANGEFPVEENTAFSLADKAPEVLYRDGNHFAGWYTEPEFTNAVTSLTIDGNKTVYAKWEEGAYLITSQVGSYGFVKDDDGVYSSNNKGVNTSEAKMTITAYAAGKVTFKYQASSEAESKWDYLKIQVNGSQKATAGGTSVTVENGVPTVWKEFEFDLAAGGVVTIIYVKDSSGEGGADTGWIKDITFVESN